MTSKILIRFWSSDLITDLLAIVSIVSVKGFQPIWNDSKTRTSNIDCINEIFMWIIMLNLRRNECVDH